MGAGECSTIRFMLGWSPVEIAVDDPNRTLLQYLREDVRLRGTKEGCAEGDCGACTVLIGELKGGEIKYRPANACIVFLPMVDGKQVLTVEHVAVDGPHPAQTAMVDAHASQCGFCTPGLIMSMIGMGLNDTPADRRSIDDALTGNLCRCTGYAPIITAARATLAADAGDEWRDRITQALTVLQSWTKDSLDFVAAPRSRAQLANALAAQPDAVIVAGATDAALWVTKQGRRIDPVIFIGDVDDLSYIEQIDGWLEIGAVVTYAEALERLGKISNSLGELVRRIGSHQVRSSGTIGGNIANGSPIGDMPPALIALGSVLRLESLNGVRDIALEDFFIEYGKQDLRPGEFVRAVKIPLESQPNLRCYKISKRFDQDISAVLGAFNVTIKNGVIADAKIVFGGMAATPMRAANCEAALTGATWTMDTIAKSQKALEHDFTPMTDMRASADYRMRVAMNLLQRYFLDLGDDKIPLELADRRLADRLLMEATP